MNIELSASQLLLAVILTGAIVAQVESAPMNLESSEPKNTISASYGSTGGDYAVPIYGLNLNRQINEKVSGELGIWKSEARETPTTFSAPAAASAIGLQGIAKYKPFGGGDTMFSNAYVFGGIAGVQAHYGENYYQAPLLLTPTLGLGMDIALNKEIDLGVRYSHYFLSNQLLPKHFLGQPDFRSQYSASLSYKF